MGRFNKYSGVVAAQRRAEKKYLLSAEARLAAALAERRIVRLTARCAVSATFAAERSYQNRRFQVLLTPLAECRLRTAVRVGFGNIVHAFILGSEHIYVTLRERLARAAP